MTKNRQRIRRQAVSKATVPPRELAELPTQTQNSVEAEHCFLPLFMLGMGLWGSSRAKAGGWGGRGLSQYGGASGWGGGMGGYGAWGGPGGWPAGGGTQPSWPTRRWPLMF